MPSTFQLALEGTPVGDDFYEKLALLEVEENADAAGSLQMRIPLSRTEDGELTVVNDSGMQPLKNISLLVEPDGGNPGCIFDGYVLSHKVHVESGLRASYVDIYAQDASWLMNLEEKTREWSNTTDSTAAASIFSDYGFTPGPANSDDDSGPYTEDNHTLMQRGTDLDFLRLLARRAGRHLRISCGAKPGTYTGIFARPNLKAEPVVTLKPNDPEAPNVNRIDFEWDVMRPTAVLARQALFTDPSEDGANGDASDSGLPALDVRDLPTFAGKPMKVMLTSPADDAGQLKRRAQALLHDAQWFARCTGEVDLAGINVLLRAGDLVTVEAVGSVHSGKYLVWTVRHKINQEKHLMEFTLVRNSMGPAAGGIS